MGLEVAMDLPGMADLFGPAERAVRCRARHKRPEEPDDSIEAGDGPDADLAKEPPLPPPKELPPVKYRTIFLGVPLRSKKGKEVLGAIQSLINTLEAYGFPVKRCHADRAQELKSKALVEWLRDRGIHGTWTPGESPAGNKAELAVQHLKGVSRKAILVAGLDPTFWPLASLHASNRYWVDACVAMGITQPVLLPFGLRLHARQRTKTGYQSHWRARTLEGRYLGQAPHTPGGHLVLVRDGADQKILLTNTVYPIGPKAEVAPKPEYRLRSKTSPEFLLRMISAVPVVAREATSAETRLTPGGEWVQVASVDLESEGSDDSACAQLLQPAVGIEHAETGVKARGDSELGRSVVSSVGLSPPDRTSGSSALRTTNDVIEILKGISEGLDVGPGSFETEEFLGLFGRSSDGIGGGVSEQTWSFSEVVFRLNAWIWSQSKDFCWSTLQVLRNPSEKLIESWRCRSFGDIWVMMFGSFQGGGLWVEGEPGEGVAGSRWKDGAFRLGSCEVQ